MNNMPTQTPGNLFFEEEEFSSFDRDNAVEGVDPYQEALRQVRDTLSPQFTPEQLGNGGPRVAEAARGVARSTFISYNQTAAQKNKPVVNLTLEDFISKALADLLGMGPLEGLLADPEIEDIAINGPTEVYTFRNGGWVVSPTIFNSPDRLLEIFNRGIAGTNRKVNTVEPIADAILPGKQRISIVTYPITDTWPSAVIRIQRRAGMSLTDLVRPSGRTEKEIKEAELTDYSAGPQGGMLSAEAAWYLHSAVLAGLNIVVVGPTGVGKTTFLTALGRCIPLGQRILIIEDTPEISIHPELDKPSNVLYLRTREATVEGMASVTQDKLVRLALRQRPDALTLGEARGAEVFDLLNALNTGHKNGLTSLHAENAEELFGRVFMMLAQSERGRFMDQYRSANLVASTLNIVVSLEMNGRERRISSISELTGGVRNTTAPEPETQKMFVNGGAGVGLGKLLTDSAFTKKFQMAGIPARFYTKS